MLDELHKILGNQKLLQVINVVESLMFHLADLEAPQYAVAIDKIKAFIDAQKPS